MHRYAIYYLLSLAILTSSGCDSHTQKNPTYSTNTKAEYAITRVSACTSQTSNDPRTPHHIDFEKSATGRTYSILSASDLKRITIPSPNSNPKITESNREYYYDLWSIIESSNNAIPDKPAVQLSFSITSETPKEVYLAIGSNHCTIIKNNDKIIFALFGYRENRHAHHTIPLRLKKGTNNITIHYQRFADWSSIPENHLKDEWSTTLQIIEDEDLARIRQRQSNPHPFDSPIVTDFNSLKAEGYYGTIRDIEVFDMQGRRRALGKTRKDASIEWQHIDEDINYPLLAISVVDNTLGEPLIICGTKDINKAIKEFSQLHISKSSEAWEYRLNHLLKDRFESIRDVWWARKLTLTACKVISDQSQIPQIDKCTCMLIRFGQFESKLDNTTQYYRYFRNQDVQGPRTLIVMIPTWSGFLDPYLELLADQQFPERIVGLAQKHGVDVLLAGGLNPDIGGQLGLYELNENIQDYLEKYGIDQSDRVFLVGPCSAALTALAAMNSGINVDGVVLWTPVVHRGTYSFDTNISRLPQIVLESEQTDSKIGNLKNYHTLVYWDNDSPGHGDYNGTKSLIENAESIVCPIETIWLPSPDKSPLWGPRETLSIDEWMSRLVDTPTGPNHAPQKLMGWSVTNTKHKTVKQSLLAGFSVTNNFANSAYCSTWKSIIKKYRGSIPTFTSSEERKDTLVDYNTAPSGAIRSSLSENVKLTRFLGMGRDRENNAIWGFQLKEEGDHQIVEVLTSLPPESSPPNIDLLLDGCCRAAFWSLDNGRWRLEYFQQ